MKIEIVATGERVAAEGVEMNCARVGDVFYSGDEYKLVYRCDSCDFETTSGIETVAHEKENPGHYCDV